MDTAGYTTIARVDRSISKRRRLSMLEIPALIVGGLALLAVAVLILVNWPPSEARVAPAVFTGQG